MGVTVQEAMQVGGLSRCSIVAGANGIQTEIQYVTVMEVPDVIPWLKGRELIITSLYAIRDDELAIGELVDQLSQAGSAGLAIKTQYFTDGIPQSILDAANRLGFPVIEIDPQVSYLDIMTPLMNSIFEEPTAQPEAEVEEFFKLITEMAMEGRDSSMILPSIQDWMGNEITLETLVLPMPVPTEAKPLTASQRKALLDSRRSLPMKRVLRGRETTCVVTPIILNHELQGLLTCWETQRPFRPSDVMVLERVVPLFALEILKIKTRLDVEQKYRDDFMLDILLGHHYPDAQIREKEALYRWDLSQQFLVFVVDIDHFKNIVKRRHYEEVAVQGFKQSVGRIIDRIAQDIHQGCIFTSRSDTFIVLHPYSNERDSDTLDSKARQIGEKFRTGLLNQVHDVTVTVGISRPYTGVEGIAQGYREALQAITLGRTVFGRNTCIFYDDLGVYRFLKEAGSSIEMQKFVGDTLAKVSEYDLHHQSDLMKTLESYFEHNYNLGETADAMYIHVNTLKYRLKRVEEITGCCLSEAEGQLQLHLGLKIYRLLQAMS
ncbi:PucR family transcriptional regulator ligand-binding domain-containing protein [Alicyclobacillus fastidiosus]|uniref:PucR family transcriptional regulator ligand-binding domain-containing protein n=1 Tax=Alicyclobacillus fastidiosus TaxID=392011 RepID=A0ABY6ZJI5_9BACL|nr:PucR family transcriptional regulator [Alicyclobacillus fastidiosus]WAH43099.1 PucR family transcriptional regulator ligand-binding domain-containing protein [Alicyclobacillus fastidiosus]GMA65098.1 CdaR family transcriptional regulator [Alicyclobacillus fastidiosus]